MQEIEIRSVADVLELLSVAAGDALAQEPSLSRARTLAYIATAGLKAVAVGELESRLELLEERFNTHKQGSFSHEN